MWKPDRKTCPALQGSRDTPYHLNPETLGEHHHGIYQGELPSRIAFRVFSGVDSRTILDTTGATGWSEEVMP
jgi:hypothetical protein